MGDSAEQMAKDHGIRREDQDKLALRSHQLAHQAWEDGKLDAEVIAAYAEPYKSVLMRHRGRHFWALSSAPPSASACAGASFDEGLA